MLKSPVAAIAPAQVEVLPPIGGYAPPNAQGGGPLSYHLVLIFRWRWQIFGFALLIVVGTLLLVSKISKQYESTVVIRIDTQSQRLVDQSQGNVSSGDAEMLVTTEQQMVTSQDVLGQTVDALRLTDVEDFAPPARERAILTAPDIRRKVIANLASHISVTRPFSTLLLSVGATTHDPNLSAMVANGLAAALLDHEYKTREKAITDSSHYMGAQLDDLQAKMERSQAALVDYETKQDVLNADDKTNILQSRLQQTNEDLGRAQSERVRLQAQYEVAQGGSIEALLNTDAGSTLIPLEQKLTTDQATLAHMANIYGPVHPLFRQQQAAVVHDNAELQNHRSELARQLDAAYRTAQQRESLLGNLVQQQKRDMDDFNLRAVRYSILKGEADSDARLYYDLLQRTKEADVSAGLRTADGLRIASTAVPNPTPVSPRVLLDAMLALFFSLGLGCAAAMVMGVVDQTLVSPEQTEALLGLSVMAWLPAVSRGEEETLRPIEFSNRAVGDNARPRDVAIANRSPFREAVLAMSSILLLGRGDSIVYMITSALPGEGKSTILANLAAAFASSGQRTILIDADLRKPKMHRMFGCSNAIGLAEVLRKDRSLESAIRVFPEAGNLYLLPAGNVAIGFSVDLLQHDLGNLLDQLRTQYDVVLVDSPPVLGLADAVAITHFADVVLLAVYAGSTDRRLVATAVRQLRAARAPLTGIILNHVKKTMGGEYSYYGKYDGYYDSEDQDE